MKRYWIPEGDWPIGTGFQHAHNYMASLGLERGTESDYDVLVLPGGADLGARPQRDEVEFSALETAQQSGKHIFGICRGMQLMLAHSGEKIIDHLPDEEALLEHRTLTGNWKGQSGWHRTQRGLLVNSRHHQGFLEIGGTWEVIDRAPDGIVEAIRGPLQFGVQWHPEHPEMINTYAIEWLKEELKICGIL